jgi:hypothetical protein
LTEGKAPLLSWLMAQGVGDLSMRATSNLHASN